MQKIISTIKECMTGKTCCEETGADCNQGRACPVRAGTHKPAEAVHQIQEPTVNQQLTDERAALAATPAAEPFGYFKAEPFGWTDCGPDDEGAVALYEKPQALLATGGQAQARSKNGWTKPKQQHPSRQTRGVSHATTNTAMPSVAKITRWTLR